MNLSYIQKTLPVGLTLLEERYPDNKEVIKSFKDLEKAMPKKLRKYVRFARRIYQSL
jgi:hypothetical protein